MKFLKRTLSPHAVLFLLLAGCAATNRSCASCSADAFGANWVVTQMDNDGRPYRCWDLHDVSVVTENGDGVYWKDSASGNLVHIAGHYNRVQVVDGKWDHAYAALGLTQATCAAIRGQSYDPTTRTFNVSAKTSVEKPAP